MDEILKHSDLVKIIGKVKFYSVKYFRYKKQAKREKKNIYATNLEKIRICGIGLQMIRNSCVMYPIGDISGSKSGILDIIGLFL